MKEADYIQPVDVHPLRCRDRSYPERLAGRATLSTAMSAGRAALRTGMFDRDQQWSGEPTPFPGPPGGDMRKGGEHRHVVEVRAWGSGEPRSL
jgi:hypothetical protein